ncbi:hypothetical protein LZ31DRAFT_113563 [Colletotrichum somersetense]|nr:hypothetical protein LZ31DRAFT_113563 [Colletotrichum somersetense]
MQPITCFPPAYGAGRDRQAGAARPRPWALHCTALHPRTGDRPLDLQVRLRPPFAVPLPYQFCIVRKRVLLAACYGLPPLCQFVVCVITLLSFPSRRRRRQTPRVP